jgi:hypothetical protein
LTNIIATKEALLNAKMKYSDWNPGVPSSELSPNPFSAARRIYDGFADIEAPDVGLRLSYNDPFWASGSCFARELERELRRLGGNVTSVDYKLINKPEFQNGEGRPKDSFFHRFTPAAIWQEMAQALGELPNWGEKSLIFDVASGQVDMNYWSVRGSDLSPEATATRRRIGRDLVRRVVDAKAIALTLGLIESWFHKPSGLWVNFPHPKILLRRPEEFELHLLTVNETMKFLEDILELIKRNHRTGDFTLFVTVSPVPLTSTFTGQDIVTANTLSKSTLRTAVGEFVRQHNQVVYFPSYEIVNNSSRSMAWRPDRLHVAPEMVAYIMKKFTDAYYEPSTKPTA